MYWLITQEAMAPSRHDWKIVDWDVKPQHNQPTTHQPIDFPIPEVDVLYSVPVLNILEQEHSVLVAVASWKNSVLFAT